MFCISMYSIRGHSPVGRLPLAVRLPTAMSNCDCSHILTIWSWFAHISTYRVVSIVLPCHVHTKLNWVLHLVL